MVLERGCTGECYWQSSAAGIRLLVNRGAVLPPRGDATIEGEARAIWEASHNYVRDAAPALAALYIHSLLPDLYDTPTCASHGTTAASTLR